MAGLDVGNVIEITNPTNAEGSDKLVISCVSVRNRGKTKYLTLEVFLMGLSLGTITVGVKDERE
jgi:hypothetical protein